MQGAALHACRGMSLPLRPSRQLQEQGCAPHIYRTHEASSARHGHAWRAPPIHRQHLPQVHRIAMRVQDCYLGGAALVRRRCAARGLPPVGHEGRDDLGGASMATPLSLASRYPLHDALQHARQITARRQNELDWRLTGGHRGGGMRGGLTASLAGYKALQCRPSARGQNMLQVLAGKKRAFRRCSQRADPKALEPFDMSS